MGAGASAHVQALHTGILQEAIKRKVDQIEVFHYCISLSLSIQYPQDEDEEFLKDPEVAIVLKKQV
jgi:hypothetical protein